MERSFTPLNPRGWNTFRRVGCFVRPEEEQEEAAEEGEHLHNTSRLKKPFLKRSEIHPDEGGRLATTRGGGGGVDGDGDDDSSPDHHERHLLVGGPQPVRLEGTGRTPESCARHCSTKIGGGIGFFGISSGDR